MIKKIVTAGILLILSVTCISLISGTGDKSDSKPIEHLAMNLRTGFESADKYLIDAGNILIIKDLLELTKSQEQKIEDLMMTYQESAILKSAEIKIKELRFANFIRADKIDKKEMARHIREISKEKTDWVVSYINHLLDLRDQLTPQQLEILKKMRKQKKQQRNQRINTARERWKNRKSDIKN